MFENIIKAAENFCIHQLQATPKISDAKQPKNGSVVAYIDIEKSNSIEYRIYLVMEPEFVQTVAKAFFDEDESDHETLMDMALECTNLIVGSAKVLASESEHAFNIKTPELTQSATFDYPYDEAKTLTCNDKELFIAIKELQ